jgi:hypothetical protein
MMKKTSVAALVLYLIIPLVTVAGGALFSFINPEIAAGHPNYVRNYQLLHLLKMMSLWTSMAGVAVLWVFVCLLMIRSKRQSNLWLFLAALGPLGFAALASLKDQTAPETDSYSRFVGKLSWFVRAAYEILSFVVIWELAWQAVVLKSTLMIRYEAFTTGASIAQINAVRDASSGMWAFGEGLEEMYLAVLFYLLRPFVFRIVAHVLETRASAEAR